MNIVGKAFLEELPPGRSMDVYEMVGLRFNPKCCICGDSISPEWLDGNYEIMVCPKKAVGRSSFPQTWLKNT